MVQGLGQRLWPFVRTVPAQHWLLLGLILWLGAWDLHAVLLDQRFRGTDNFTDHTAEAYLMFRDHGFVHWWTNFSGSKGPLPVLLSLPLLMLVGRLPLATRLLSCIAHGTLTWQTYHLTHRIGGDRTAGLWAALLCSTTPLIFGLFRLTHYDVPLTIIVMGTIQLIISYSPGQPRSAIWLGLITGGGWLTKPTYPQYVLWPFCCLLLRWWRHKRFWLQSLVIAGISTAILLSWLVFAFPRFSHAMATASWAGNFSLSEKIASYSLLPDIHLLLGGAFLSLTLLAICRKLSWFHLGLHLSSIPMLASLFWLVDWSRYLLPIIPLLAIPIGLGLGTIQSHLPRLLRLTVPGILAAVLLTRFLLLNVYGLQPVPAEETRERFSGMISADRREYPAYSKVHPSFPGDPPRVVVINDTWSTEAEVSSLAPFWALRWGKLHFISMEEAQEEVTTGQAVNVLLVSKGIECRQDPHIANLAEAMNTATSKYRWFLGRPRRQLLARARDPDGLEFTAWRVW